MRRPYIFFLPILLGQCVDGSMPGAMTPIANQRLLIESTPVLLNSGDPDRLRSGALTFKGGWQLTSPTRSFGGLSALDVDGNRITALGDGGTVVRFSFGRFGHVSDASIVRIPEGCGQVSRKMDNDTESLAHDPARTIWWVGFEWRNVICRIGRDLNMGEKVFGPPTMARWPRKGGTESMTRLSDGRFLVIAEDAPDYGRVRPLLLFDRDPTDPGAVVTSLGYRPPVGYKPTDVAQLPDGRLLILNRRFTLWSLFTTRLVLTDPIPLHARGVLQGRVIAHLESPLIHDNFEGLSITVEHDKPMIWLISDDNFERWQRTLLLKFELN